MKFIKNIAVGLLIYALLILSVFNCVYASNYYEKSNVNLPSMTELAKYAFSWADHTNIKYVWGGGRNGETLEELDKVDGTGTDCSGFTSLVYAHFGINIPAQSEAQRDAAVDTFTDESKAVPGDILWWSGHVGLYLGQGKMIHTNTSRPPYNYPHVADVSYRGDSPVFCRMVDDVSKLGAVSSGDSTTDGVANAQSINNIVTESDLTGMPIPSTLLAEQERLSLKDRSDLTASDLATLAYIHEQLDFQSQSNSENVASVFHVFTSFVGICLIFYGILLLLAYFFDYSNTFIEVSLLSLLSFGRYRILEDEYLNKETKGYKYKSGKTYLSKGMLIARVVVIELVGFFLVSGFFYDVALNMYYIVYNYLDNYSHNPTRSLA